MIALLEALETDHPAQMVFLDHDLGGEIYVDSEREDTGMEVVRWIEANRPPVERFIVHSYNQPAAFEMVDRLVDMGYAAEPAPFASEAFFAAIAAIVD